MSWFLILWKLSSLVIWFQQEFVHFLDLLPLLWLQLYHLCFWFYQVFKCLFYILASNFIKLFSSHLIIISKLFSFCYEYPAEVFSPWLQIRCIFLVSNYINAPSFDAWSLIPLLLLTFNLINVFFSRFWLQYIIGIFLSPSESNRRFTRLDFRLCCIPLAYKILHCPLFTPDLLYFHSSWHVISSTYNFLLFSEYIKSVFVFLLPSESISSLLPLTSD